MAKFEGCACLLVTGLISLVFPVTVVGQTPCKNVSLVATGSSNYITSPNFPSSYSSNTDCRWTIKAGTSTHVVALTVLELSLQSSPTCQNDYLSLHDGFIESFPIIDKMCGNLSTTHQFRSTDAYMTVVFHTDASGNGRGFRLAYKSISKTDVTTECSSATVSGSSKTITSPNYPSNYSISTNCQWNIAAVSGLHVVVLKILEVQFEPSPTCSFDYVTIYNGPSTGSPVMQKLCYQHASTQQQFISNGSYMTVTFRSDGSVNDKGFKLEYSFQQKPAECNSGFRKALSIPQFITSPNYPFNYPSGMDCEWIIKAEPLVQVVMLKLLDFHLAEGSPSCLLEYVAIYDGYNTGSSLIRKMCGEVPSTHIISTDSVLTVAFHSFWPTTYRGFRFEYTLLDKPASCAGVTLTASSTVNHLAAPNYPLKHKSNTFCQWHIAAESDSSLVVLELLQLNVDGSQPECGNGYLKIYDGPSTDSPLMQVLCDNMVTGTFVSTDSVITVVLTSFGEKTNYTAFNFTYRTQEQRKRGRAKEENSNPEFPYHMCTYVKYMAIAVGSSLFGTSLAAINVLRLYRRKQGQRKSSQNLTQGPSGSSSG